MLSLLELKELLGDDVINAYQATPHRKSLRESGASVVTSAIIDDDTLLEIYDNGFVLYEAGLHCTVFPIRNALSDYKYDDALNKSGHVVPLETFYDMPWMFRVLMEGEDRVLHSIYTSPTVARCAPLDLVMNYILSIRDSSKGVLDVILFNELLEVLHESEQALTEYQSRLIHSMYHEGRSMNDMVKEIERSRHAIEDAIERGLINMRKVFKKMGFEIDDSLLKYK